MKQPTVIEIYADNGALSHYALIDSETGEKLWSEFPEECKAKGYPVTKKECPHDGRSLPDPLGGKFCVECGCFVSKKELTTSTEDKQ